MEFKNPYWSTKTKIELLQKWILVHSILYYELDNGIVSDAVYDANAKLLVQLAKADHGAYIASKWHSVFKGFGKDGCYS
jgi:NAD-dependent DNA ligase